MSSSPDRFVDQLDRIGREHAAEILELASVAATRGHATPRKLMSEMAGAHAPRAGLVGKYALVREVARGGMGVVFEAIDPELRRRVALKVLRSVDAIPEVIERFRREAAIAAQLRHPHIVVTHEVGEAADSAGIATHFIAMEYVDGVTLEAVLRAAPPERAVLLQMFARVTEAVAHAHGQGVVHRDLKPANVLVEQPTGRIVLTDFGLAMTELFATRLTRSSAVLGTPHYMAPEQVAGRMAEVGKPSDVYALGVMLYRILSGRLPFEAATSAELFAQIQQRDPAPLARTVPRGLAAICWKAMQKEPARRYASAVELGQDLARFREGAPVTARLPGLSHRLRTGLARRKLLVVALLVLGAVGGVGGRVALRSVALRDRRVREAREAARTAAEQLARARSRAAAMRLLELGRPALNEAALYLYDRNTSLGELRKLVDRGQLRFEEAIRKAPDLAVAHYLLGRAWELKGHDRKAEACWRQAIRLDPACGPAHLGLAHLLASRAFLDSWAVDRTVTARAKVWAGQVVAELEAALRSGTAFDDQLQQEAARALKACINRQTPELARIVGQGIERFAGQRGVEQFHLYRVRTLSAPEGLKSLERALDIRPKYFLALYFRGMYRFSVAYGQSGDGETSQQLALFDRAIADLDSALAIKPGSAAAFSMRGRIHWIKGRTLGTLRRKTEEHAEYDRAIADYDQSLRQQPDRVEAYRYRALIQQYCGRFAAAIADYDQLIRLRPGEYGPYASRGMLHGHRGDRVRAVQDLERALWLAPLTAPNRPHLEAALRRFQRPSER